ncbi:MAG: hypothetical protein QNJ68_02455 [Microcoleaceae cyanobacterium MO_207.B10]|nr:hypothetical protein [Microcoleaceae cyanobacterium MO_207.B10]
MKIILLATIGFSVISNYGISWDEHWEINMVFWNVNLITKGKELPSDAKYYGTVFNFSSEAIFQANEIFQNKLLQKNLNQPTYEDEEYNILLRTYKRIKIKHILTFLISLVTYFSVAGIVAILAGLEFAWLAPINLALFPRFWGHSFFNPKDIPFAAMFTLATLLGACLVNYYIKANQEDIKLGINRITIYSILYGILIGLVTGTRIGGFFFLFFVPITHIIVILGKKNIYKEIKNFWCFYGAIFLSWMVTTTIFYPASWSNPIGWFFETLQYLSKHKWSGTVFFDGKFISGQSIPWHYLPKLLLITTPLIFLVTFVIGLPWILFKYKKFTNLQRACVILLLLQVFFLPMIAIIRESTIYDGIRQFIFILPGIAVICSTTFIWIYQKISRKTFQLFTCALIVALLSPIVLDMVALHPYEYIYFNRISGGLPKAYNQYETDYWGLSMREAMEWINNNGKASLNVVSSHPVRLSKTFANPEIKVIDYREFNQTENSQPFYYLAMPRWDYQDKFSECELVYQVMRQGVPLSIVRKCDSSNLFVK